MYYLHRSRNSVSPVCGSFQKIVQQFCTIFRFMVITPKTPLNAFKKAQKSLDRTRIVQKSSRIIEKLWGEIVQEISQNSKEWNGIAQKISRILEHFHSCDSSASDQQFAVLHLPRARGLSPWTMNMHKTGTVVIAPVIVVDCAAPEGTASTLTSHSSSPPTSARPLSERPSGTNLPRAMPRHHCF